jgi:hypothetical protein
MKECFRCKSPKVVKGATVEWGSSTAHRQIFRPDHLKFTAMTLTGGVPLDAYACSECGLVWAETDTAALRAFVEKNCKTELP